MFSRLLRGSTRVKCMVLGRYPAKSLVEIQGDRVWIEDRVRGDHTKGAMFVVMLQAAEKWHIY